MMITVEVRCGCGALIVRTRRPAGRPTKRCDNCRKRAARTRARRHYADKTPDQRRAERARWREANRERYRETARRWARDNMANVISNTANHRARKQAAFIEAVDRDIVFVLGGGLCGVCGLPADPTDFHVDHVIPLARGGEHSYANTQPAHPTCNRRKNVYA